MLMNWMRSALELHVWSSFSKRQIRRSVARGFLRIGKNSAKWAEDLALWIDPTLEMEASKSVGGQG